MRLTYSYLQCYIHSLIKTVSISKIIKDIMHKQDAIYLDQLSPR